MRRVANLTRACFFALLGLTLEAMAFQCPSRARINGRSLNAAGPPDDPKPWTRKALAFLAGLSLKDAAWRKKITDNTAGVDISTFEEGGAGPATEALKALSGVVDAETVRARQIVDSGGAVVRPKDAAKRGPLGDVEAAVVFALENLVAAERERARVSQAGVVRRPRDASHPEVVGLLGELERDTEAALAALVAAERARVAEGGALARPADVDAESGLGRLEADAKVLIEAEVARLRQMVEEGTVAVRPMDVGVASPLASVERSVRDLAETVRAYELARLAQLRANGVLPARPMDASPASAAGLAERFGVGLFRAPVMLERVAARTWELLAAAEGAADAEAAAALALEREAAAALARRKALEGVSEGAARGPVLLEAVAARTKELLKVADEAAEKESGLP